MSLNGLIVKGLIVLITFPCFACSDAKEKSGVIPEAHLQALEKARGVEKQQEELRKKLDED